MATAASGHHRSAGAVHRAWRADDRGEIMQAMVLARRPGDSRRDWLTDARDDGRRTERSWHRHDGLVFVGLTSRPTR